MEINIETFRNGDWYIKYFSKEKYAQALYDLGQIQVCPLSYFIGLEKQGRGDNNEGFINGPGILYCKEEGETKYKKLVDYTVLRANTQSLIFCISDPPRFVYEGETFIIDPKIYDDFGENTAELFVVFVNKKFFEEKLLQYCKIKGIGLIYGHVCYSDNELPPEEIGKIIGNESHKHYFKKGTKFHHQCEYRYVIQNTLESFLARTNATKTANGYIFEIGALQERAFLAKIVR